MLEERYMKIRLKNEDDRVKVCKAGFSFTTLIFGPFVPLYRADFLWTGIMFVFHVVLNYIVSKLPIITSSRTLYGFLGVTFISNIVFALIYNRIFIKNTLLEGYTGYDKEDEENLIKKHFSVTAEQIEAYKNKKQERLNKKEEKRALKEAKEKDNKEKKKENKELKNKEKSDTKKKKNEPKKESSDIVNEEISQTEGELILQTDDKAKSKKKSRKKKKSKEDDLEAVKEDINNKSTYISETIDEEKASEKVAGDKAELYISISKEENNTLDDTKTSEITTGKAADITKENEEALPQEA